MEHWTNARPRYCRYHRGELCCYHDLRYYFIHCSEYHANSCSKMLTSLEDQNIRSPFSVLVCEIFTAGNYFNIF